MRIGIDYTAAVHQRGGIGRYTRNLIRALAGLDRTNRYTLLVAGGTSEGDGLGPWPANFRSRSLPFSDRWMHILWQRARLPIPVQVITGHLDLFHSPDFVLPPTGGAPSILTVHDLSFMRVPECYVPAFREYLARAVMRAVRRADRILADSQSTRRDLIELMAVDPEQVAVIYPGVESRFRPILDPAVLRAVQDRYGLPQRFVLGLSTIQPRKNFPGLVEAFGRLIMSRAGLQSYQDLSLVIVGGRGWMAEDTFRAITRCGLEGRVQILGFVKDDDLPTVYSLASVFAFPSWYEGFGLPVLEAMACGTPVVAANNSSLPEVVGRAGLLVDAGDAGGLAQALELLLEDGVVRNRLSAAGREQAARFTWESAAHGLKNLCGSFA